MTVNCNRCGAQNSESAEHCVQCGQSLTAPPVIAAAAPAAGPSVFASFWRRVGATLIDVVILIVGIILLSMLLGMLTFLIPSPLVFILFALLWPAAIVAGWLYAALFESGAMQATPGKKVVGLKVTDLKGNRISFGRATGRHFSEWITGMTFLVGYVMVAFTQKRQTLHDMIAETVVVASSAEPAQVASAPPAKPMSPWGIAGIFLLLFLLVAGIIASAALPAYRDFTVRSQVMEGIVIAEDFKNEVTLFAEENGRWPADLAEAELEEEARDSVDGSRYLSDLDISNGTITLTFGKSADEPVQRKRLSLRPYVDDSGSVLWLCGRAAEPADAYFEIEEGGLASDRGITNLPDNQLPQDCRAGALEFDEVM